MALSYFTILVAEDDEDLFKSMHSSLLELANIRKLSLRIEHTTYFFGARMILNDPERRPVVISTDMAFPRSFQGIIDSKSGARLISLLRQLGNNAPVVVYGGDSVPQLMNAVAYIEQTEGTLGRAPKFLQKRLDTQAPWAKAVLDALFTR